MGHQITLTLSEDAKRPALIDKSDEELWRIAGSQLPLSQLHQWRRLIAKHEAGNTLTPDEERILETLLEAGERLTALKAEAYALLKQRGHSLPQNACSRELGDRWLASAAHMNLQDDANPA